MTTPSTAAHETVDTTDSRYQVTANFPGDKSNSWHYPIEDDGWIHAHNALRGEVQDMKEALQAFPKTFPDGAPKWAVSAIQQVWKNHHDNIHGHHTNEDAIMTPFLKTRIVLPDKLEDDHHDIDECMKVVTERVNLLNEGGSVDDILKAFLSYEEVLLPHLVEEERVALPLCRAFFTHEEVNVKVREIISLLSPVEFGSFIHYMSEDQFRSKFMKQEGIPFFVWWLSFRSQHKAFLKEMKAPLDALKSGVDSSARVSTKKFLFF